MKKKQRILATPPSEFHWIEDISDLEKLAVIYSKLESISTFFSHYNKPKGDRPEMASEVYGYWFIIRDICKELADVLKLDYWTGEVGITANEESD